MIKKILSCVIAVTIMLALSTVAMAAAPTTQAIKGTPVIDGEIDELWKDANAFTLDQLVIGTVLPKGKVRTMWDEKYLYILIEVEDNDLFDDETLRTFNCDSIYYNIEEDNDKSGEYVTGVDKNNSVTYKNRVEIGSLGNPDHHTSATKVVDGGYIIEIRTTFASITGEIGRKIGFTVSLNEANNMFGTRVAMASWVNIDTAWKDTSVMGTLEMVAAPVKASSTPAPNKSTPTTNTTGSTNSNTSSNPKTGDAGTAIYAIFAGVSGLAAFTAIKKMKKS